MKKILITGVCGFVGSHMADYLAAKNCYEIYGLKRMNSSTENLSLSKDSIKLIDGDLCDPFSMINLIRETMPDQIYHFGALSWVTPSWCQPSAYMQTNAIGTINLYEAIRINNCNSRILISCTPEEYGDVPVELIPITEDTRLHPVNHYAASKLAQDAVSMSYQASYNMDIVRTRAFNHEGSRRNNLGANASFAYQIARIECGLQEPTIMVGNISAVRNFTNVRDTIRGYEDIMNLGKTGEMYLIGTQEIYTMRECLEKLISHSSVKNIEIKVDKSRIRPTELNTFIGDFSKIQELSGWKAAIPFEETLLEILEYWRNKVKMDELKK